MKKLFLNKLGRVLCLTTVLLTSNIAIAQNYQDGNVAQYWDTQVSAWNVDTYIWPARVSNDNFFAQQFFFEQEVFADDGAYIGVQQIKGRKSRLAKFSIWNATAARPAKNGTCRNFDGEGIGKTCDLPFKFQNKKWYKLRVWRLEADANGQWWGAWIIDNRGRERHIGDIRAPLGTGNIASTVSFNEYFGAPAACNTLPKSIVYFYRPSLNAGRAKAAISETTALGRCSAGRVNQRRGGKLAKLALGVK